MGVVVAVLAQRAKMLRLCLRGQAMAGSVSPATSPARTTSTGQEVVAGRTATPSRAEEAEPAGQGPLAVEAARWAM
jgi:hypothetical protein